MEPGDLVDSEKDPCRDWSSFSCMGCYNPGLLEDSMTESQDLGTGEVSSEDLSTHDYATHTLYIPSQGRRHIYLPFDSLAKLKPC